MAILDWPTDRAFAPRAFRFGASTPKSSFSGFFSGQTQSVSHGSDRLRVGITLPPCGPADGARREAFIMEMISAGHWLRLHHLHRPQPRGSLRGAPTLAAAAAAGAREVQVQGLAGDTLEAGDVLGAGGNMLLIAGYAGAVADGTGLLTLPLVLPLHAALASGAALAWDRPTANFQLPVSVSEFIYGRAAWQAEVEITLNEVY